MEGRSFEGGVGERPPMENMPEVLPDIALSETLLQARNRVNFKNDFERKKSEQENNQEEKKYSLMQLIDKKISESDIDEKNYFTISEALVKEFGVEKDDKIKAYIFVVAGIRAQIKREKQIFNGKDDYIVEKIEYKQNIGNFIKQWQKTPEIISRFWQDMQKEYESFQKSYPDAYKKTFKGFKYGILAELAAMDASGESLKKLNKQKFGIKNFKIENASIKADNEKAIDFFIEFTYYNGRVEKIPCQVKAFDIGMGRKIVIDEKIKFCEEKMVNLVNANRGKDQTKNLYHTGIERNAHKKTEELRKKGFSWAGSHNGMMFFLPADSDILKDDGTLNSECKKMFEKKFIEQFDKYFPSIVKS